jgi:hypothetical protein
MGVVVGLQSVLSALGGLLVLRLWGAWWLDAAVIWVVFHSLL